MRDHAIRLSAAVDMGGLNELAAMLAPLVADRLDADRPAQEDDRFLAPQAAGHYLGLTRRRIHDLTSEGTLTPDGRDGRTPLFRISNLDAYVESRRR